MKKIVIMVVMTVMFVAGSAYAQSHDYGNEAAALVAMNPSVVERIREVEEWSSKRYPKYAKDKAVACSSGWYIMINQGVFASGIYIRLYWDGSLTVTIGVSEPSTGAWYPKFIPPVE